MHKFLWRNSSLVAREEAGLADVVDSAHPAQDPLKAEAEASVGHSAVVAELVVPLEGLGVHLTVLVDLLQLLGVMDSDTAADDLANAGHKEIHTLGELRVIFTALGRAGSD